LKTPKITCKEGDFIPLKEQQDTIFLRKMQIS
jgi:hypothetical protein